MEYDVTPLNSGFRRHAGFATAATIVALLGGYLNQVVASAAFGMGYQLDAYVATNALCNVALAAVGGSVGVAFAARSTRARGGGAQPMADILVSLAGLGLLAGVVLSLTVPLSRLLVPHSWAVDPTLVHRVFVLNVCGMVFNTSATVAASIVVGHGRTLLGLSSPVLVSAGGVLGALFLGQSLGVAAVAAGTLVGAGVRLLLLVVVIPKAWPSRADVRGSLKFWWKSVGLVSTGIVVALMTVFDKIALAPFPSGTVSQTAYGLMLLVAGGTVISSSLGTPLARHYALQADPDRWARAASATRMSILFGLPAATFLLLAAMPISGVLLGWGKVDAADIARIAETMRLGGGLVLMACLGSISTYHASEGHGRLLFIATLSGAVVALAIFFGARPLVGPASVPLGYSGMHILASGILLVAFFKEGARTVARTAAAWLRAAVPAVAAASVAFALVSAAPQAVRTQLAAHPLVELTAIAMLVGAAALSSASVRSAISSRWA